MGEFLHDFPNRPGAPKLVHIELPKEATALQLVQKRVDHGLLALPWVRACGAVNLQSCAELLLEPAQNPAGSIRAQI